MICAEPWRIALTLVELPAGWWITVQRGRCARYSQSTGARWEQSLYWLQKVDYVEGSQKFFIVTKTSVDFSFWTSLTLVTLTFTHFHPFIALHQTLKLPFPQSWTQNFAFFFLSVLSFKVIISSNLLPYDDINHEDGSEISAYSSFQSPHGYFQLAALTSKSTCPRLNSSLTTK